MWKNWNGQLLCHDRDKVSRKRLTSQMASEFIKFITASSILEMHFDRDVIGDAYLRDTLPP